MIDIILTDTSLVELILDRQETNMFGPPGSAYSVYVTIVPGKQYSV